MNCSFHDWISKNLKSKRKIGIVNDVPWSTTFATSLWRTWKDRNRRSFDNIDVDVQTSVKSIINYANAIMAFLKSSWKQTLFQLRDSSMEIQSFNITVLPSLKIQRHSWLKREPRSPTFPDWLTKAQIAYPALELSRKKAWLSLMTSLKAEATS